MSRENDTLDSTIPKLASYKCQALPILSQELEQVIDFNKKYLRSAWRMEVGDDSGGKGVED